MALIDLTDAAFTELDPANNLVVNSPSQLTVTTQDQNSIDYLWRSVSLSGDYTYKWDINFSNITGSVINGMLFLNTVLGHIYSAPTDCVWVSVYQTGKIWFVVKVNNVAIINIQTTFVMSVGVNYYYLLERIGTTLTLGIYSNPLRTAPYLLHQESGTHAAHTGGLLFEQWGTSTYVPLTANYVSYVLTNPDLFSGIPYTDSLDFFTVVSSSNQPLIDSQVSVADTKIVGIDGQAIVADESIVGIDLSILVKESGSVMFDGAVVVMDAAFDNIDAQVNVSSINVTDVFDLSAQVGSVNTIQLDLSVASEESLTTLIDGRVVVKEGAINAIDAMISVVDVTTIGLDASVNVSDLITDAIDAHVNIADENQSFCDISVYLTETVGDVLGIKVVTYSDQVISITRGVMGFPSGQVVQYMIHNTDTFADLVPWTTNGVYEVPAIGGKSVYFINHVVNFPEPQMLIQWNVVGSNEYQAADFIDLYQQIAITVHEDFNNKQITDTTSGELLIYARDNITVRKRGNIYEGNTEVTPYNAQSTAINRRNRLKP